MRKVKVSDAKNNLSRYLKYVQRGGRVRIMNRDTAVADLVPVEAEPGDLDDDRWLEEMARRGAIRLPQKPGPLPPELLRPPPWPKKKGVVLSEELIKDRRAGR